MGTMRGRELLEKATDDALVERMRCGDGDALAELFGRYQPELRGYLHGMTGDPELASDLVQEVFVRAWRYAGSYRGAGSVRGWLFAIARNERVDVIKKRSRERQHQEADRDGPSVEAVDERPGPDRVVSGQERLVRLRRALGRLPDGSRALLLMARVDGMS